MKKDIVVTLYKSIDETIPTNPDDFVNFWLGKISLIPKEHIKTASIECYTETGYGYEEVDDYSEQVIKITFTRSETDFEESEREEKQKYHDMITEQRDKEQLAFLLSKYPKG